LGKGSQNMPTGATTNASVSDSVQPIRRSPTGAAA
jgi:hypothetical protein